MPAWAALEQPPVGACLLQASSKQGQQLSLAWKHHLPEMHHNSRTRRIQTRPTHSTGGHSCTSSPTWAVPHKHPHGQRTRAREICICWLLHSVLVSTHTKQVVVVVVVHELPHTAHLMRIASVCVYPACSTWWGTPATPASLILCTPRRRLGHQLLHLSRCFPQKSNISC